MDDEIALATLVLFVSSGDEVDRDPTAAGQIVKRRRGARQYRRGDEAGAMSNEDLQRPRVVENGRGDRPTLRPDGAIADEHAVETAVVVRASDGIEVLRVNDWTVRPVHNGTVDEWAFDLRGLSRAHHPDDLNRHVRMSSVVSGEPADRLASEGAGPRRRQHQGEDCHLR